MNWRINARWVLLAKASKKLAYKIGLTWKLVGCMSAEVNSIKN